MLELLNGFPDDVVALAGKGHVTAEDYHDTLIPTVNQRISKHVTIRVFCDLGPEFEGLSDGAAWEDLKFGVSRWNNISRMAVVTDVEWIKHAIWLFAPFFHHPMRTFSNSERFAAKEWITSKDD